MNDNRRRQIAMEGEYFYPLNMWPQWAQTLYMLKHKNRTQRFSLWVFLVGNGLESDLARGWVLLGGGYDKDAFKQMHELVTKGPTREPGKPPLRYWDIQAQQNRVFRIF